MERKEDRADKMRIPMPCRFGERADCKGMILPISGVTWFEWSLWGMEYTYFFSLGDKWHSTKFYTTFETEQPFEINIPDSLIIDKPIKEHGYPLRGNGHVCGVIYKDSRTYVDFIMTSSYLAHIRVQCNEKWECVLNGDIIFPPSWDTEEKKGRAVLKAYRTGLDKEDTQKEPIERQLSIFEFISE